MFHRSRSLQGVIGLYLSLGVFGLPQYPFDQVQPPQQPALPLDPQTVVQPQPTVLLPVDTRLVAPTPTPLDPLQVPGPVPPLTPPQSSPIPFPVVNPATNQPSPTPLGPPVPPLPVVPSPVGGPGLSTPAPTPVAGPPGVNQGPTPPPPPPGILPSSPIVVPSPQPLPSPPPKAAPSPLAPLPPSPKPSPPPLAPPSSSPKPAPSPLALPSSSLKTSPSPAPPPPGQAPIPSSAPGAYDAKACNNFAELCTRQWSSIVHLGAHDSPFVRTKENGFSVSGNQYFDVKTQLDAGVRLLQGQIHKEDDKTYLCHSSCKLFDGGLLVNYLKKVREWMDQHPSDVVTILLVNNDKIPATTIKAQFDSADLTRLTYAPTGPIAPTGWPTLGQLIAAQRRLIVFTSVGADAKAVPWLLDEFSYIFETAFEVTDPRKLNCTPHRPGAVAGLDKIPQAVAGRLPLLNRFLYAPVFESRFGQWVSGGEAYKPNDTYVATLNGGKPLPGNLRNGLALCMGTYKRIGGFVLVDFFNEGSPIKIVDEVNGVSKPVNRIDPPPTPDQKNKTGTTSQFFSDVKNGKEDLGLGRLVTGGTNLVDKIGLRRRGGMGVTP